MKWLYIYGVDNLSVSGGGTIDGAGQEWWARSCKRKKTQVRTMQIPVNQPPTNSGPSPGFSGRVGPGRAAHAQM
jgi:hypothetical protein